MIRRRSCIAGRPPGSAVGTVGAINSHWESVRSDGYGVGVRRFLRATTDPIQPPSTGLPRSSRTLSKHSSAGSWLFVRRVSGQAGNTVSSRRVYSGPRGGTARVGLRHSAEVATIRRFYTKSPVYQHY